ncbi:aldo/keto reductase [Mycena epipterygia]|nr:aldo/keto reductase [Mycena epipterygia]
MAAYFTLNNGTEIPSVGMGCWMGDAEGGGDRVYKMCLASLECGYRHFDTASGYGNEKEVGRAIRDSEVPRSEIYLTTKLGNGDHHRVKEAFAESIEKLGVEYIDLYLMHWPMAVMDGKVLGPEEHPTFIETWKEIEKLLETRKVKTIGVSNFSIKTLEQLLPHCSIIPATNQVELHPCLPQNGLKAYCEDKGILLTAYSPLGRSTTFMEDATVKALATKLSISPAQIVLSWAVQRAEDMSIVDNLHKEPGMHKSLLVFDDKKDGTVFGWTYEQLGWKMAVGGHVTN